MHISPLLGPVVALVAWSIVMLIWMAVKRRPFVASGRDIPNGSPRRGSRRHQPGQRTIGRRTITST